MKYQGYKNIYTLELKNIYFIQKKVSTPGHLNAKDKITTLDPSTNRDVFCFYGLKQQSAVLCQADELEEN